MDWMLKIVLWLAAGVVLLVVLWKSLKINWDAESPDTRLLLIVTPVAWPLVLLLIAGTWLFKK